MDAFDGAQTRQDQANSCSCHGLCTVQAATTNDWIVVQPTRINSQGHHVDQDLTDAHNLHGKYDEAMKEIKAMHAIGRGIIVLKL